MFESKEELLVWLLKGYIHLGKKDYQFFYNLKNLVDSLHRVTTNQSNLYTKLLNKYQRQINRAGFDVKELENLEWKCKVLPSSDEYINPHVFLRNDKIIIRNPFNSKFLQDLKKLDVNPFTWIKSDKVYEANFSTQALKIAYVFLNKHFNHVVFDESLSKLITEANTYALQIWEPTLVKSNNNYFIACLNDSLYACLKDSILQDNEKTLMYLSSLGVKISDEILENDSFKQFAGNFFASVDTYNLSMFVEWCKLLEVDSVFTSRDLIYNKNVTVVLEPMLTKNNITIISGKQKPIGKSIYVTTLSSYNHFSSNSLYAFDKIVTIKNSTPIKVV